MAVEIINSKKLIKFDCIDTWAETYYRFRAGQAVMNQFLENIEPVKHIVTVIRKDSADAAENYLDRSVDFVFVDGDHSYEGASRDIKMWLPKLKPFGILAGHEYNWSEVRAAVNDIFGAGSDIDPLPFRMVEGKDKFSDPWGEDCFILSMVDNKPTPFSFLDSLTVPVSLLPRSAKTSRTLRTDLKRRI
jgi:hypothetical protein